MSELLCVSPRCRPPGRHATDCTDDSCRGCLPARAADGLRLCWYETEGIGKHVVELAALWSELGLVLVGGGAGDEGIRQRNPGAGLNLKPAVIDVRATIRHTLVSWTRLIAEERGFGLPADSVHALGKFVAASASWLAAQDFADEVAVELAELVSAARSLRQPSQTRIIEIGPCPRKTTFEADEDGDEMQIDCTGMVRALLRSEASLLPSAIQCDADETHSWDSTQWSKLGRAMQAAKKERLAA